MVSTAGCPRAYFTFPLYSEIPPPPPAPNAHARAPAPRAPGNPVNRGRPRRARQERVSTKAEGEERHIFLGLYVLKKTDRIRESRAAREFSAHTARTSGRRVAQQSVHGRATNVARVATPALAEATSLALCPWGVARLAPAAEGSLSVLLLLLLRLLRVQNGADARVVGVHAGQRAQDRRQEAGILEHG